MRTYAPLFPVRVEPPTPPDRESRQIRSTADRWRFALVWRDEPRDQYDGIVEVSNIRPEALS